MTISIHADGHVVVWLGSMRLPPFATTEARHELRRALDTIDGVHLHRTRVNAWPRFPRARLEDLANLMTLVAVLDRIAEESHTGTPSRDDGHGADGEAAPTVGVTAAGTAVR